MPLRDWKKVLLPQEVEALEDYGYTEKVYGDQKISRSDVFEVIVDWNGGMATAYQIKNLIFRVYGIQL